MTTEIRIDSLLPPEMARRAEYIGVRKAEERVLEMFILAVWLTFSARTTVDKSMAIIFPISAFVAAGFEHSIANMYCVPIALLIKQFDPVFAAKAAETAKLDLSGLTWPAFLVNNLLPVTIGNIIGGAILVAAVYWLVYLRRTEAT